MMTLKEIIAFVDDIKPNAFSNRQKTVWLNEVEGLVQTDVFLLAPSSVVTYIYEKVWSGTGISFPDSAAMVFPVSPGFRVGGTVTVTGLLDYAANQLENAQIKAISDDGKTLFFEEGTFSVWGETAETASVTVTFDGSNAKMLVLPPHHKIYYTYLMAMIDFANGEYSKYQNTMALFNNFFGGFTKWYVENYQPADGSCLGKGYYLSAYAIAVKHGFDGTEEEFLYALKGDRGETGNGICRLEKSAGTGAPGTTDTYTITMTDGDTVSFTVYNGNDGDSVTVDPVLSSLSTNPVQNNAVKAALADKSDKTIVDANNYYGATERDEVLQEIGGHIVAINGSLSNKADLFDGTVPAAQLPSYVDDVIEVTNYAFLPLTGETGKIYVNLDTNKTYRWSGSGYAEISESLALGTTSSTAYRGDRGATAYTHSQTTGNPHGTTKNNIGLGNVDNTSDSDKPISMATQSALNGKQNHITADPGEIIYMTGDGLNSVPMAQSPGVLTQTDWNPTPFWISISDLKDEMALEYQEKSDIVNMIYPVGSIYLSVSATSPATLFGGTWVQLQNRFLVGVGSDHANGDVGGNITNLLSKIGVNGNIYGGITTTSPVNYDSRVMVVDGSWTNSATNMKYLSSYGEDMLPPYLAVYMWKRTA